HRAAIRSSSSLTLFHRSTEVESHQLQELLVPHLGEIHVCAAFEKVPCELLFRLDHVLDFFLNGALADKLVHKHVPGLADPKGAFGGLVLNRRVPPPVEMDDMRGRGEIEPGTTRLEGQHEERNAIILLEAADEILSPLHLRLAVQHEARLPKHGAQ